MRTVPFAPVKPQPLRVFACLILAGLVTLLGGCSGPQPEACGPVQVFPPEAWEVPGQRLRCEFFPDLCGLPVTSRVQDADLNRAIDIVFVAEGFTLEEQSAYADAVDALERGLDGDAQGFVAAHLGRFNYHRVDVASLTHDTTNAARGDTALGVCFELSPEMSGPERWQPTVDPALVELVSRSAPDVDVVVVVIRADTGGANARPVYGSESEVAFVLLPSRYAADVLTHELGHALFGLGDEYGVVDECYPAPMFSTSDPFLEPNLSLDPEGARWRHLVEGARPGGFGYRRCIYHPTDRCRMNADSDAEPFCPVCQAHIEALLRVRAEPAWNDGPPRCALTLDQAPDELSGRVLASVFAVDPNGLGVVELALDGAPLANPPGVGLPSTCLGAGQWACNSHWMIDTTALAPGEHLLELLCADSLGLKSNEAVTIQVGP